MARKFKNGEYVILMLFRKDLRDEIRKSIQIEEITSSDLALTYRDYALAHRVDFVDRDGTTRTLKELAKEPQRMAALITRPESFTEFDVWTPRIEPKPVMRWDCIAKKNIESPSVVEEFLDAYADLCYKYGLSLAHEDRGGAFIITDRKESNITWARQANLDVVQLDRLKEEKSSESVSERVRGE